MPPKLSKTKNPSKSGKANDKAQKPVSSRENKYESTTCNAVLFTKFKIEDDKKRKEEAQDAFEKALRDDTLYDKDVSGKLVVGNQDGLFLAELAAEVQSVKYEIASQKDEFSRRLRKHEDEIASHKEEIASQKDEFSRRLRKHEDEIASHKEEIVSHKKEATRLGKDVIRLQVSSTKYMQLRNRYISTFKRDKLGLSNGTDKKIIKKGNDIAHGPNVITDAALYTSLNQRSDKDTFEKLYGLNPSLVSGLCHNPTIAALNTRAGIISSPDKVGSEKFNKLFNEFIDLLKESNEGRSSLENVSSKRLNRARSAFCACVKFEVCLVDPKLGGAAHLD
ncbi:hypothetical protein B9Z19DRAFT_1193987 [Tuber borchii]|uniref:Uncharacterized protein n=1 Tax=Tuber borchii TaxID=42251 RepID=A0A2T6ZPT4_TUBBO|nr:hypothetical protein B9Z19DRAFT_1193987 [Tuber borchii]